MAAIYSNGGNRWNILGFNFTKRDALSSVYKISMHDKGAQDNVLVISLKVASLQLSKILSILGNLRF
jgi:hypothetical protein